jgi:hypothetical protein
MHSIAEDLPTELYSVCTAETWGCRMCTAVQEGLYSTLGALKPVVGMWNVECGYGHTVWDVHSNQQVNVGCMHRNQRVGCGLRDVHSNQWVDAGCGLCMATRGQDVGCTVTRGWYVGCRICMATRR